MLIISVLSVLMGLILLVVPHMKIISPRSTPGSGRQKTTLLGKRKQIVAGLYIAVGVAGIFTVVGEVTFVIAWVAVHFFAVFFMLDYAPAGLESPWPKKPRWLRLEWPQPKKPRWQTYDFFPPPLPKPDKLPPDLHAQLIKIAEQGPFKFDTRSIPYYRQERRAELDACTTLSRMGLSSCDWTGPGECVHVYSINDAGKQMLAKMAQDAG